MAEPVLKRVKVENGVVNNAKQPIVFEVPRLSVPDSGFFDKIFDWPGSMDWLETMSYKYDLGTCGSSLSDWDLQTKSSADSASDYTTWTSYEDDISAFHSLLMAFYGKPFSINHWNKLSKITDRADRFKALPCLSTILPMIYSTSPSLLESIDGNAHMILPIASKLRDAVLFKECIIFVVNPWNLGGSRITSIEDPGLRVFAREAFDEINAKVGKALCSVINYAGSPYNGSSVRNDAESAWSPTLKQVLFPRFFKRGFRGLELEPIVADLLKNNSLLVCRHVVPGEAGKFDDYFLSVNISEDKLPWDVKEIDW
ncbi:hypothetical protein DL98DRAFT_581806 [Cadophora sp. DSE1049]|nr:hypothetical protein DL98DRAFT_581806 [Cadophora sp. DSE1049]